MKTHTIHVAPHVGPEDYTQHLLCVAPHVGREDYTQQTC